MAQLASVVGYAVVVAFTTLPVLAVIAVLLDTGRPARGWQLTAGYAAGLVVLFVVASFGLARVPLPRFRDAGGIEIAAGVLLLLVAFGLGYWHPHRSATRTHTARAMTARRAVLVGLQFAFHPENLALTFAAAAHVSDLAAGQRLAAALLFTAVGVSTVALPTLAFRIAGDRIRDRLDRLRQAILAHGLLLTRVLLAACGVFLIGLGLWNLLSL